MRRQVLLDIGGGRETDIGVEEEDTAGIVPPVFWRLDVDAGEVV